MGPAVQDEKLDAKAGSENGTKGDGQTELFLTLGGSAGHDAKYALEQGGCRRRVRLHFSKCKVILDLRPPVARRSPLGFEVLFWGTSKIIPSRDDAPLWENCCRLKDPALLLTFGT